MSYSEELCEKSLRLIFENGIQIIRNYRPNWLKNPRTNKNLELDFYIPHIPIAIEIQGQHHYDIIEQKERDELKKKILLQRNITLLELSIFQIHPNLLRRKILNYSHFTQYQARIKSYDPRWNDLTYIKEYKLKIHNLYGNSTCCLSPHINKVIENKTKVITASDEDIMLNTEFSYKMKWGIARITPIEIISPLTVKCRILGSEKIIFVKKKHMSKIIS